MGLFGSSGDTSGSYGSDSFESKLRKPSNELDFSEGSSLDSLGGASANSDIQTRIQIEQQKAELVGQVANKYPLESKAFYNCTPVLLSYGLSCLILGFSDS